jgi:general secretion pathway protein D
LILVVAGLACSMHDARAQDGPPATPAVESIDPSGRRVLNGPPTKLTFKNATVEQIVPFIVESTGKVVIPQKDVMSRSITVLNDREIPRAEALDLVLTALQQAGVAVVENETMITLRDISEIVKQEAPVIGENESVLGRKDLGTIAEKVFVLKHSTAESYADVLKTAVPDYAKITIDKESNRIAVLGNIALLKRLERLIGSLDRPAAGALVSKTFVLKYADATQIAENVKELFSSTGTGSSAVRRNQNQNQGRGGFRFPGQQEEASTAGSDELRVSANTQQNAVTVVADPGVIAQVEDQILNFWDRPLPEEAVVPKIYDLKNTDPVKMRDLLEGLFGRASSTAGAAGGGGGGQGQGGGNQGAARSSSTTQGVGRLAGQFSFQAVPESGRLVVVAKSPDNIAVIDKIIEDLDRPQSVGLPVFVELKHAQAEDLAEQLNTILSQDGTLAQIRRAEEGLSEGQGAGASPFSSATTTTQNGTTTQEVTGNDVITFWWQRSRPPTDQRNASNLVGKIRIVPVWRQNALMILSPPEYKNSIVELVTSLDRPGRQVLISAVLAEISREDATAFGLRWSNTTINPTNPDNVISIGTQTNGTQNDFISSLFDTSTLNVGVQLNAVLQALSEKTNLNILSEPRIFTSDNQEAEFFNGQDVPFVTDSQTNQQGNLVQSFDYRAVGIQLRVRPRITVRRDVDLRVNVELSSIVPGQTLFGGFIVDRRETTTQLIVRDGQTVVISGIMRSEVSDIVRKVPILGDIPILDLLFKSKEKGKRETELLVFITPVVVDNDDDSDRVNKPFRERLELQRQQLNSRGLEIAPRLEPGVGEPTNVEPQGRTIQPEAGSP